MTARGVGRATRETILTAVRLGGNSAWLANAEQRRQGKPRIIPEAYLAIPDDAVWPAYREALFAKGIRAGQAASGQRSAHCAAGDAPLVGRQ
jgi:hypothetical protein